LERWIRAPARPGAPQPLTRSIAIGHFLERNRANARCLSGAAERLEARLADLARARRRGLEELAWVEVGRAADERAPHRGSHRNADVGIDVHLANALADARLDLLDRDTVGLGDVAAILAQQRQPLLRHGR